MKFDELDEIERYQNKAKLLREEIKHLQFKEASAKYDKSINTNGIEEKIEENRKELNRILIALKKAKIEMGDEYDRYQINKGKQR